MQNLLKRLAFVSLLGFPIAVLGSRLGLFGFRTGILIVALTLLIALIVCLASVFCLLKRRFADPSQSRSLKLATLMSVIPLVGIGSVIVGAADVPKIHNISTDIVDPPAFDKVTSIRTAEHNSLEYNVEELAEIQRNAYPEIKTLRVDLPREVAQAQVVDLISALGWQLHNNDIDRGIVEASETSTLWGFTDDIVVRLTSNETNSQTAIDLRSVSRVGQSDLGANAKRIKTFIDEFSQRHL